MHGMPGVFSLERIIMLVTANLKGKSLRDGLLVRCFSILIAL